MKTKPFPLIICRTPAFSLQTHLSQIWEQLKEMIKESSPSFYELIKNEKPENIPALPEKTRFTLWKYMNRAKYRATPFGSFAAISLLPLIKEKIPPILEQHLEKHHLIDWGEKETYISKKLKLKTVLLTNSSAYQLADEVRYLNFSNGHFELASVNAFTELNYILDVCRDKTTLKDLYVFVEKKFNLPRKNSRKLVQQLISIQLLITDHSPNITGTDFFHRLKVPQTKLATDYIIASRKTLMGGINEAQLKSIPSLINFLHQTLAQNENQDLTQFKRAFSKKFEHQTVNLAIAMDPEAGIGYGNLAQMKEDDELIAGLKLDHKSSKKETNLNYTKLHGFLLNKLSSRTHIQLEEFNIGSLNQKIKLPNTFSLMFHFYGDNLVIDSAGGCTANALMGRFTMISETLTNFCIEVAETEQQANPAISFFDIAYQVENHIDNVNRRKRLYPQELPILTYPEGTNMLNFEDLLVSLKGNEVILTSKKLGQRIIPRIPSAYNYNRSDLAVYRFLCDVQNQGLATNLNFKLHHFFKGLTHYPRVYYGNIIVSPAMWLVPEKIYERNKIEYPERIKALKLWLKEQQINFLFKTGVADHTLCFNPNNEEDLNSFLSYCNQHATQELYITEALITTEAAITDEQKQSYAAQYIASYFHEEQVYAPVKPAINTNKTRSKADIKLPGEDWLYFDIYTHPSRSNELLLNEISMYLHQNQSFIKKWFFIRYTDPAPHIRLRLHLTDGAPGFEVIHSLMNLVKPKLLKSLITDFNIKTYYRETQRYGTERIDLVEAFFHQDSAYILSLLTKTIEKDQWYANALLLFSNYCKLSIPDFSERLQFVVKMAANFAEEMHIEADHFKKINASYTLLNKNIAVLIVPLAPKIRKAHEQIFTKVMHNCNSKEDKEKMLADLIHMHINRLFKTDQRMHETIIYQYLLRMMKKQQAFLNVQSE